MSKLPTERGGPAWRGACSLMLCALAVIITLGVAELILRRAGYGEALRYEYVPETGWVYQGNQHARTIGGWRVRINSVGLRGPEYKTPKPPRVFRIVVVGDSLTFGYGVAEEATYGARLQRMLTPGRTLCGSVEVINGGVNGYNTQQEVALVRLRLLSLEPDILILGFTPNDIMAPDEARTMLRHPHLKRVLGQSALYQFLVPRVKAVLFRSAAEDYATTIRQFIAGDPSVAERAERVLEAIQELRELGRAHSFKLVVVVFPLAEQAEGTIAEDWPPGILRHLEATSEVPVIDVLPAFRAAARAGGDLFLHEPTRHPSAAGLNVVALEVKRILEARALLPQCDKTAGSVSGLTPVARR